MIVVLQNTPWNPGLQSKFHESNMYISNTYYFYYYYIIALSKILSTLHIILHLVQHIVTKWFSDNQDSYNLYIFREREGERERVREEETEKAGDDGSLEPKRYCVDFVSH